MKVKCPNCHGTGEVYDYTQLDNENKTEYSETSIQPQTCIICGGEKEIDFFILNNK